MQKNHKHLYISKSIDKSPNSLRIIFFSIGWDHFDQSPKDESYLELEFYNLMFFNLPGFKGRERPKGLTQDF